MSVSFSQEAHAQFLKLRELASRGATFVDLASDLLAIRAVKTPEEIAKVRADKNGFGVVREYCGHGVGLKVHEDPEIPNYVCRYMPNPRIKEGMVIAIEPMINLGTKNIIDMPDGWTVITADHKPSAHFEHTVAITANGPEILTQI